MKLLQGKQKWYGKESTNCTSTGNHECNVPFSAVLSFVGIPILAVLWIVFKKDRILFVRIYNLLGLCARERAWTCHSSDWS